jgi:2-C-methyl-D-erythritol 4-phosphate cytidylyltransferase/2-C-methyl-D-erythritol 2,4-cyclodiphosphate synthase
MTASSATLNAALIVAAGRGTRAGGGEVPKQYRTVGGISVLRRSIDLFLNHPAISFVQVVIGSGDAGLYAAAAPSDPRLLPAVEGGQTRQESVLRGLDALETVRPDRVLIHDAARPFAGGDLVGRVVERLDQFEAVLPALPVADTLKSVGADGLATVTVPREGLFAAQTPQGFAYDAIRAAHRRAASAREDFTDDAGIAVWSGMEVAVVPGEAENIKLTTAADIAAANHWLTVELAAALGDVRVGTGYDVHAFGPGDHVTLGGVVIAHGRGLVGHSDADVALHALTDAILGAVADGDIGAHFPPSDPQWKGAASDRFLAFAAARVAARGGIIAHLDLAIMAEEPRIGPHRDAMRARIAAIAGVGIDRVAVKATTNERLGFIGRGEGIAAIGTATIRLPSGVMR